MAEASGGGGLEQVVETCGQCSGSSPTVSSDGVCSNCSGQPIATSAQSPAATRDHSITGNSATGGHGSDPASLAAAEGDDASSNTRDRIANGKDNSTTEERQTDGEGNGGKKTPGDEAGVGDGETKTVPGSRETLVNVAVNETSGLDRPQGVINGNQRAVNKQQGDGADRKRVAVNEQHITGGSVSQLPENQQKEAAGNSQQGTGVSGSQEAGRNRQQGGGGHQQELNAAASTGSTEVVNKEVSFAVIDVYTDNE